jgi:hypothetical protein
VKYYHGTSADNVESILSLGLDPRRMDEAYNDEEPVPFVFLSRALHTAVSFAPDDGVVFEVTPPKEIEDQFVTNLGEFVRSPVTIPPSFLRLIHEP